MITIRSGELFVEKYNEENGTNLTPKEKKMVERVLKIWDNYLEGKR